MSEKPPRGLIPAFQEVTDGVLTLVRQHLQLARAEIRYDARLVGRNTMGLVAAILVLFLGYLMLNLTAILLAGLARGLEGMAVATFLLTVIHIFYGIKAVRAAMHHLMDDSPRLQGTAEEIQRSKQWMSEVRQR